MMISKAVEHMSKINKIEGNIESEKLMMNTAHQLQMLNHYIHSMMQ